MGVLKGVVMNVDTLGDEAKYPRVFFILFYLDVVEDPKVKWSSPICGKRRRCRDPSTPSLDDGKGHQILTLANTRTSAVSTLGHEDFQYHE